MTAASDHQGAQRPFFDAGGVGPTLPLSERADTAGTASSGAGLAFYNEIDPAAAQWLRNLIVAGLIPPGVVDERSIEDITPEELHGFTQCHFFAGIGGWPLALRRAGWPDDRPVWTGSCPCQPFSEAGKGDGFADERHLWPAFHWLIAHGKRSDVPVFGEQVASKPVDAWIDLVQDDLEAVGHALGAVAFPSASVGAPHIRDRCYWVADADCGAGGWDARGLHASETAARRVRIADGFELADAVRLDGLADAEQHQQRQGRGTRCEGAPGHEPGSEPCGCCAARRMADTDVERSSGDARSQPGVCEGAHGPRGRGVPADRPAGPINGFWRAADWLLCRDGRWRPVEPGTFPLAHGVPGRVVRLRAYGNAINVYAAQAFIEAYLAVRCERLGLMAVGDLA